MEVVELADEEDLDGELADDESTEVDEYDDEDEEYEEEEEDEDEDEDEDEEEEEEEEDDEDIAARSAQDEPHAAGAELAVETDETEPDAAVHALDAEAPADDALELAVWNVVRHA